LIYAADENHRKKRAFYPKRERTCLIVKFFTSVFKRFFGGADKRWNTLIPSGLRLRGKSCAGKFTKQKKSDKPSFCF
jgi:hypothetical protein